MGHDTLNQWEFEDSQLAWPDGVCVNLPLGELKLNQSSTTMEIDVCGPWYCGHFQLHIQLYYGATSRIDSSS